MPEPEHRFEVPLEYAEVYERAYRRAYEEHQVSGLERATSTVRSQQPRRGARPAIPQQRSAARSSNVHRADPSGVFSRRLLIAITVVLVLVVLGLLVLVLFGGAGGASRFSVAGCAHGAQSWTDVVPQSCHVPS